MFFDAFGFEEFYCVRVIHCTDAFAVIIKHKEGWKISYSGDTRPCEAFAQAGINSSVLIHEATFEDSMEQDAIDKNHSTTKEAIDIGDK